MAVGQWEILLYGTAMKGSPVLEKGRYDFDDDHKPLMPIRRTVTSNLLEL